MSGEARASASQIAEVAASEDYLEVTIKEWGGLVKLRALRPWDQRRIRKMYLADKHSTDQHGNPSDIDMLLTYAICEALVEPKLEHSDQNREALLKQPSHILAELMIAIGKLGGVGGVSQRRFQRRADGNDDRRQPVRGAQGVSERESGDDDEGVEGED